MQDIHTLGGVGGGGGGRIFSGGVDRRLQAQNLPSHPPLKCPRCDSQNTKFCYYNNYNLSQPRHFCKNCRRYWTKGGVLRNVPVGGGCRKSKRSSKSKPSSGNSSSNSLAATTDSRKNDESETNSHSSSESSSLTASTTAATKPVAAAGAGTGTASSANAGLLLSQHRGENDVLDHFQPLIEHQEGVSVTQMVPISNMVSSSNDPGGLGLNPEGGNEPEKAMIGQQHEVQVDPTALDWGNVGVLGDADVTNTPVVNVGGGEENGLFDFSGVDESYWNHAPWVEDNDQAFNFLPQFQVLDFNLEKK